jgi:hypothetical protein
MAIGAARCQRFQPELDQTALKTECGRRGSDLERHKGPLSPPTHAAGWGTDSQFLQKRPSLQYVKGI